MVTTYIRNTREASAVARVAREFGVRTSVRDIYAYDRYLINIAERLFGADIAKTRFIKAAREEVMALREQK